MTQLTRLPADLPVPLDDGACNHLVGMRLPPVALPSTRGDRVTLSTWPGRVVIYCYPMTGRPDRALPDGWDTIPGARDGVIEKVFYPVFPPDRNARDVMDWLAAKP